MNRPQGHPVLVAGSVMLATIMQVLDTTIANIALPHMRGSLSASLDQIAWVLTSYIVASAILTLPVGFLARRFGRRRIMLYSTLGFTLASMLCGQATSLEEMILWRIVQGVCGAAVVPLSQAILLDSFPQERHATAMSIWGLGIMVGPVMGPTLGGWLTEYYNWRWVFYVNVPTGIIALLGMYLFLPETPRERQRFDIAGFALLGVAVASLQLLLDRGNHVQWLESLEIQFYALAAVLGLYLYLVQARTSTLRFLSPELFRDVNFISGTAFIFVVGVVMLGTMTLLPPFLQQWQEYPVLTAGIVLAPRGVGTIITMSMVSFLLRYFDPRTLIALGMGICALALHQMAGFTLEVEPRDVATAGFIQGLGMGLVTVPTSILSFATLPPRLRNDGAALYSLGRSLGCSIGVSLVITFLTRNLWINQQQLGARLQPSARLLTELTPDQSIAGVPGKVLKEITRQAAEIAYVNDFHLLSLLALAAIPLVLLLKVGSTKPTTPVPEEVEKPI